MDISWTTKKIEHRDSTISGTGVFARTKILKGEVVAIFGGYCVDIKEFKKIKFDDPEIYNVVLEIGYQVDDTVIFAPTNKSQYSTIEYLNHNCTANCGFSGAIHLVALRNIEKGTEVCMDYATCITSKLFEMKCSCGSNECRGQVRATDWKLRSVQRQYRNHFQPYILKKIKASKLIAT
jgi:SET domain-containing protein